MGTSLCFQKHTKSFLMFTQSVMCPSQITQCGLHNYTSADRGSLLIRLGRPIEGLIKMFLLKGRPPYARDGIRFQKPVICFSKKRQRLFEPALSLNKITPLHF